MAFTNIRRMISSPIIPRLTRVLILSAVLAGIFLCAGAMAADPGAGTSPGTASSTHYKGILYHVKSGMQSDPACSLAYGAYADDPYCSSKAWEGINVICGKPPAQCIDTTNNGGIRQDLSYYIVENTGDHGEKSARRVLDGISTFYESDGSTKCYDYKDNVALGNGYLCSPGSSGDGLPLIPIAVLVAILVAGGIGGAKLLGGKGAGGGGTTAPATPPATTRTWTDGTGRTRTATLQPDGTWISDSGSVVDLEKAEGARRDAERGRNASRADQAGQIADDTAKADRDRQELEKIRSTTDKAVKDVHDKQWKDYENQRDADTRHADMWKQAADRSDRIADGLSTVEKGADIAIDIGATLSPVVGGQIKTAYNATKTIGKNMAESATRGESVLGGAAKGALEAAADKTLDMFGNKLGDKFNGKIPGFGKFESAKDYGSKSLKTIKDTMSGRDLKNSVKNALQSQAQSATLWDPLKKFFTG
jgi:hypothetical protein